LTHFILRERRDERKRRKKKGCPVVDSEKKVVFVSNLCALQHIKEEKKTNTQREKKIKRIKERRGTERQAVQYCENHRSESMAASVK